MLTSPIKSPGIALRHPFSFSLSLSPPRRLAPIETPSASAPRLLRCSSRDNPAATALSAAQPIPVVFLVLVFIIKKFEKDTMLLPLRPPPDWRSPAATQPTGTPYVVRHWHFARVVKLVSLSVLVEDIYIYIPLPFLDRSRAKVLTAQVITRVFPDSFPFFISDYKSIDFEWWQRKVKGYVIW